MREFQIYILLLITLAGVVSSARSQTPIGLLAWGRGDNGCTTLPPHQPGLSYRRLAGGHNHAAGVRSNGSIVAWGNNAYGQTNVPTLPLGVSYTDVAAGWNHTLALRTDGSIVAWGFNQFGQCTVPVLPTGRTYVAVAAGGNISCAIRSDGTAIAWGENTFGACNVPALPSGRYFHQVAVGDYFAIGVVSDGSVVGWGRNEAGQCTPPAPSATRKFVGVAAGEAHAVGLMSDGTLSGWGRNNFGQVTIPTAAPGTRFNSVTASGYHSLALRSDGVLVAFGSNGFGESTPPLLGTGTTYGHVEAGYEFSLAISCSSVSSGGLPQGAGGVGVATWPSTVGGNGHQYEVVHIASGCTVDWIQAHQSALNAGGHLVTIGSQAENDFIFSLIDQGSYWAQFPDGNYGPWIGGMQLSGSSEPADGWRWLTSEPFLYSSWASGFPNNACGGASDRIQYWSSSGRNATWRDLPATGCGGRFPTAYIVEYEPSLPCTNGPGFSLCAVSDTIGNGRLQLFNLPANTIYGKTLVSTTPSFPIGSGAFFGLAPDPFLLSILLAPNVVGDPTTWLVGDESLFPRSPFYFPPTLISMFAGMTWDFAAVAVTTTGSVHFSNYVQKTW